MRAPREAKPGRPIRGSWDFLWPRCKTRGSKLGNPSLSSLGWRFSATFRPWLTQLWCGTEVVFELPSLQQTHLMMASNDIISTVMYWIIWDLADCALPEVPSSLAPCGEPSLTWLWIKYLPCEGLCPEN